MLIPERSYKFEVFFYVWYEY